MIGRSCLYSSLSPFQCYVASLRDHWRDNHDNDGWVLWVSDTPSPKAVAAPCVIYPLLPSRYIFSCFYCLSIGITCQCFFAGRKASNFLTSCSIHLIKTCFCMAVPFSSAFCGLHNIRHLSSMSAFTSTCFALLHTNTFGEASPARHYAVFKCCCCRLILFWAIYVQSMSE